MSVFAKNKITKTFKFQSISLIENGLILKYKNKKPIEMPYSELYQVTSKNSK